MWDSHLESIIIAKDRMELINLKALPLHSVPYRTGPVARKL